VVKVATAVNVIIIRVKGLHDYEFVWLTCFEGWTSLRVDQEYKE
jgi:hypothetical protein